jgi:hypothetical protein
MKYVSFTFLIMVWALGIVLGGCASDLDEDNTYPHVLELSHYELVIGETLYVYARNISKESYKTNKLFFEGEYLTDQGQSEAVSLTVSPEYDGFFERDGETIHRLRINRVGPFRNPFSESGRPGIFQGRITAITEDDNGDYSSDLRPQTFAINVEPSIYISEFQPYDAQCGEPAVRALEGIGYTLRIEVAGIAATRFEYQISQINGTPNVTRYVNEYETPVSEDEIGYEEPIFFNPISVDEHFYVSLLRIKAYDKEGEYVETALPISVHRPLEIVYDGKREIAERYEPIPVSGCTPGSINTRVNYTETKSEYRQRTVSMTVSENWVQSEAQNLSKSWLEGVSEGQSQSRSLSGSTSEEQNLSESMNLNYNQNASNSYSFNESNGENWSWSVREGESNTEYADRMSEVYGSGNWKGTVKASAEGSIPFLAKSSGSVSTSVGVTAGGRAGNQEGQSVSESNERGYTTSGSKNESQGFGSTLSEGRGQSVNNSYALGRVNSSNQSENMNQNSARTWNLSQSESNSNIVSMGGSASENITITSSDNDTTTQAFSGVIPRGQFGVFYRQTTRWVRRAEVRSYNQCGIASHVGELVFNEYTWAPNLALSSECEEAPPLPNFPIAGCMLPPCDG